MLKRTNRCCIQLFDIQLITYNNLIASCIHRMWIMIHHISGRANMKDCNKRNQKFRVISESIAVHDKRHTKFLNTTFLKFQFAFAISYLSTLIPAFKLAVRRTDSSIKWPIFRHKFLKWHSCVIKSFAANSDWTIHFPQPFKNSVQGLIETVETVRQVVATVETVRQVV